MAYQQYNPLFRACVDWLGLFMTQSKPLCLLPIYRARTVSFVAQTLSGQLGGREEELAEFDKKCMGLELYTVPLTRPQSSYLDM